MHVAGEAVETTLRIERRRLRRARSAEWTDGPAALCSANRLQLLKGGADAGSGVRQKG